MASELHACIADYATETGEILQPELFSAIVVLDMARPKADPGYTTSRDHSDDLVATVGGHSDVTSHPESTNGCDVRHKIRIDAPPATVFALLTDDQRMMTWLARDVRADPRAGGIFQYTIDLSYSSIMDFEEADFVVAGPGALDGISKCFADTGGSSAEDIIYWMTDRQDADLAGVSLNPKEAKSRGPNEMLVHSGSPAARSASA